VVETINRHFSIPNYSFNPCVLVDAGFSWIDSSWRSFAVCVCFAHNGGLMIYVSSRASIPERSAMWRKFRDAGVPINSTWIDEAGAGETDDFSELWSRIEKEVCQADILIFYAEPEDFPLKGALVEVGMALGAKKRVILCMPGVKVEGLTSRPIGSWIEHPSVVRVDDINTIMWALQDFSY
jgi:hypothetical protein